MIINQCLLLHINEDPEPLKELEAIAEVDGIDMLFFGPADFSHGIGAPCQWDDPRIASTRKQIAEAAIRHGKFAGTVGTPDNFNEIIDMGYRFINIGADVHALNKYCKTLLNKFQQSVAKRSKKI